MAGENLNVVEQALATARTNLKMVQSRFNAGFSIKSDLLRAKVRIAKLEQQRALAQSHVETAWANLSAMMGTMSDDRYRLISSLKAEKELDDALSAWIYAAMHNRPDLKQVQYQHQIAEKAVKKARGAHLPSVNLIGKYEINSEDFDDSADNYMLGAGVRINLFSGLRHTAKELEARSLLVAAKARQYQRPWESRWKLKVPSNKPKVLTRVSTCPGWQFLKPKRPYVLLVTGITTAWLPL